MSKSAKIIVIVFILLFSFLFLFYIALKHHSEVVLGGKTFYVEVADTDALQTRGLSGHAPLANDEGMIFLFPKPDLYGFWMKDMTFPLDIIWIDSSWSITHIEKSLAASTYPKIFSPSVPSQYVLEISAGQSDILNLKIGDKVGFYR